MLISADWLVEYIPDLATLLLTVTVSFLSLESGFRFGRRRRRRLQDGQEVLVRTMVGAMVSLTAFTLAVIFGLRLRTSMARDKPVSMTLTRSEWLTCTLICFRNAIVRKSATFCASTLTFD